MDMESSVSLDLKVEPASPLWELELLDEVGEIWEGDVTVIEGELDVDLVEDVDTDAFWGQQDISELIGKEEQILGLELDEITLEDQDVKEGDLESFYAPDGCIGFGAGVIGPRRTNFSVPTEVLVKIPCSETLENHVSTCAETVCDGYETVCSDPLCAESVCTDATCNENTCTDVVCAGATIPFQPFGQTDFANIHHPWVYVNVPSTGDFVPTADDLVPSANDVPKPDQLSFSNLEPFTSWLDNGAIYDGPNSTVSGLPTFNTPSLWSAPESPSEEKAAAFTVPAGGPAAPDPLQGGTADLFTEFEDVLSQAAGSLTPPDSPRSASAFGAQALLQLAPNLQPVQLSPASGQRFIVLQEMANSPGVNYELDELMAETYQKNGGISVSSSGNSSPISSSSGTKTKGRPWDSPSASSSGFSDSGYDDPEWSSTKSTESRDSSEPSPAKKRCLNSTEERRLRKKEQNKNAATRYRMKKKMEMEEIIGEEKELMDRHDTLKSEVVEITREIRYLKGLMGDLFRAKGLIRAK
uniref:BZIP domain-containing protein n=1 Tax=Lygus hesperus TaxID=30085 RepID=A0A0K8T141_LYGHE